MKKFTAISVAALILLSFISCSSSNGGGALQSTDNQSNETLVEETAAETTTEIIKANVPDSDFEGYGFAILTYEASDIATRLYKNADVESENGDTINDAIFRRNLGVEDKLNISISQKLSAAIVSDVKKSVQAGDNTYDCIISAMSYLRELGVGGFCLNLYSVPYIDMEREYWDVNLKESFTINGILHFNTGDITVYDDMRVASVIFNKGLWNKYSLPSPYDIVKDGKWTVDKMIELGSNVTSDVNGDGVLGQDDLWGIMTEYGAGNDFFFASGEHMIELDSSGNPKIVFGTERVVNAVNKMLEITLDSQNVFLAEKITGQSDVWPYASMMFQQDQVLMRTTTFEPVPRDLRAMETDFGVLPFPKFEESQENYCSLARVDGYGTGIPSSVSDVERTGIIVESLAAESISTITPAFYDLSLQGKVLRDEESKEMLDIIFGNKVYDIGYMYAIGGFDSMLSTLVSSGKTDFASQYVKKLSSAENALQKLITTFGELE